MTTVWETPPQRNLYSMNEQFRRFRNIFLTMAEHPLARDVPQETEALIIEEFSRLQRITKDIKCS